MRTCNGNVGLVVANVGAVTYAQLAQMDIPFDELHFGKPYADVYIDDLAVNANLDTSREIGWYAENTEPTTSDEERAEAGAISGPKKTGMIAARDFNVVQIIDNKVIKSSKADKILGEIYLYSHMPPDIAHLFPRVDNVDFILRHAHTPYYNGELPRPDIFAYASWPLYNQRSTSNTVAVASQDP